MKKNNTKKNNVPQKEEAGKASDKTIWIFFLSIFCIIPLLFTKSAIDQVLMLRYLVLSLVLLFVYLYYFFISRQKIIELKRFRNESFILWFLFILASVLSLVNAINPVEGFFDIMRIIVIFALLFALVQLFLKYHELKYVLVSVTILGVIYLLVGYVQYFKYAFGNKDLSSLYQVTGIWTHKNFYSSMLFLMLPILFYCMIKKFEKKFLFAPLITLILILIFLLQTRSVWLSVLAFLLVMGLLLFLFRKSIFISETKKHLLKGLLIFSGTFILSLALAWAITSVSVHLSSNNNNSEISRYKESPATPPKEQNIENIEERAASMFNTEESNIQHRLVMWKMSLKMIQNHPLLGVGAGNWKIVVGDYLPEDYNLSYYNNIRRPHNDLLWIFSEKGAIGFLLYMVFFIFLLIYSFKLLKKEIAPFDKVLIIISLAAIAGYFADSCLSFPHERIEHQIFLMLYVSLIISSYIRHFPSRYQVDLKASRKKLLQLMIPVFLLVAVITGRIWLREEIGVNKAKEASFQNNWAKTIDEIEKASTSIDQLDPNNTPLRWYSGKAYMKLNDSSKALDELSRAYEQNPNSLLVLIDLGSVYLYLKDYNKAIELFKESLEIYPKYQNGLQSLGTAYYLSERYPEALDCFTSLAEIAPNPEIDRIIEEIKTSKLNK